MELIRKAVGYNLKVDESSESMAKMARSVSKEEWLKASQEFYSDLDGFVLVETSTQDMAKTEELLGVQKGFFKSPVIIKTSQQLCLKCGRKNNFLDVVVTALNVHSPQFLVDVFSGKFGYILNSQRDQRCFCYDCKTLLPKTAAKLSGYYFYRWNFSL